MSNRLTGTLVAGVDETYSSQGDGYDNHGNMLHMPHLSRMEWDFQDRLRATARQHVDNPDCNPETTYYVYDAAGQRVRKVTECYASSGQTAARKKERIYVAGFEVYREYNGNSENVSLVRETLHAVDDKQRIALVERRTQGNDNSLQQVIRYQFSNHLGSASLELDQNAKVISYEEYSPYGSASYQAVNKTVIAAVKRYRYTKKEQDEESGFYYFGVRYQLPWLGIWAAPDPAELIDGQNVYQYVKSSPVKYLDQVGMQADDSKNVSDSMNSEDIHVDEGRPSKEEFDDAEIIIDEVIGAVDCSVYGLALEAVAEKNVTKEKLTYMVSMGKKLKKKLRKLTGKPRHVFFRNKRGELIGFGQRPKIQYVNEGGRKKAILSPRLPEAISNAKQRFNDKLSDTIRLDKNGDWVLVTYRGSGKNVEGNALKLMPGMRIWTAEAASKNYNSFKKTHVFTYVGEGEVTHNYAGKELKPVYKGRPELFVVLQVWDPSGEPVKGKPNITLGEVRDARPKNKI
jgi:RHS repeat-associated protein